jgi:hypothetical protein
MGPAVVPAAQSLETALRTRSRVASFAGRVAITATEMDAGLTA